MRTCSEPRCSSFLTSFSFGSISEASLPNLIGVLYVAKQVRCGSGACLPHGFLPGRIRLRESLDSKMMPRLDNKGNETRPRTLPGVLQESSRHTSASATVRDPGSRPYGFVSAALNLGKLRPTHRKREPRKISQALPSGSLQLVHRTGR